MQLRIAGRWIAGLVRPEGNLQSAEAKFCQYCNADFLLDDENHWYIRPNKKKRYCKMRRKKIMTAWEQQNPENCRLKALRWQEKNPDKIKVYRDRTARKIERRYNALKGQARARHIEVDLTFDDYREIVCGENCFYCCGTCNVAKRSMTYEEFLSWIEKVYNKLFRIKLRA